MFCPWWIHRLVCAGVLGLLAAAAHAAEPIDVAKFMPGETAIYIGWTAPAQRDSAELQKTRELIDGFLKLHAEDGDQKDIEWVTPLVDALMTLATAPGGLGLFDVTVVDGQPNIQAALVVAAGADSAKLAQRVQEIATKLGPGPAESQPAKDAPHSVRDVPLERLRLPGGQMSLVWGVHHDCFILALGDVAAGKVIDCLNGSAENLAAAREFQFVRQKVGAKPDIQSFCIYADVQRIISRVKGVAEESGHPLPPVANQLLDELGLTAVRSKYLLIDRLGDKARLTAFAHIDGPMRGLLKIWDQQPLVDADLMIVPKDAYWAYVSNLDLSGLWQEAQRILNEVAPDSAPAVQGALAASAQVLGFSLTDDLLPTFGDTWAVFDAPAHGGLLLTGSVLVADVADEQKLESILERGVQMLTPFAAPQKITLLHKETKDGEHVIHYVLIGGVPSPVAPAWGFVDHRWVFGLFPQTVAVALREADPKTRGETLLDQPDVKAARAALPKEIQAFSYFDSRYLARLFYPLLNAARTMGLSLIAKTGGEIDLTTMPPVNQAVEKVTNYVGTTSKDADGVLIATVGDGCPLPAAAAGGAVATTILLPSLARAREVTKTAVSASNLRGIGMACHVYADANHDRFPPSFDVLVKDGSITEKMLQSPRDPADTVSYVYVAGQTTEADAQNVLAYERNGMDDRRNVLFLDGHVQAMPPTEFKKTLRDTYHRLGREDEMPAEFRD